MKKILKQLTVVTMALVLLFTFAACGGKDESSGKKAVYNPEEISKITDPEELEKKAAELNANEDYFLGTWEGTSGEVKDLYGNLSITINEKGTFDANVTNEDFSGEWTKTDEGIEFSSVYISGKMYFGKKCRMVIYEENIAPIVMKKVD